MKAVAQYSIFNIHLIIFIFSLGSPPARYVCDLLYKKALSRRGKSLWKMMLQTGFVAVCKTSGDVSNLTRVPGKLRVVFAVKFSISVLLGAGPLPRTLLLLSPQHAVVRRNALLSVAACFFSFFGGGLVSVDPPLPFSPFQIPLFRHDSWEGAVSARHWGRGLSRWGDWCETRLGRHTVPLRAFTGI